MIMQFLNNIIHLGILISVSLLCLGSKIAVPITHITNPIIKSDQELGNHSQPSCPPWQYRKFCNSCCECGDSIHGAVLCNEDDDSASLLNCHYMSYSDHIDVMLVGDFPTYVQMTFTQIYLKIQILAIYAIMIYSKTGKGKCVESVRITFAPSPYSYRFECSDCSNYTHKWIKYITIAYIPLTIFFLAVNPVPVQCNVPFNEFIYTSQPNFSCPSVSSLSSEYVCFMDPNGFCSVGYS